VLGGTTKHRELLFVRDFEPLKDIEQFLESLRWFGRYSVRTGRRWKFQFNLDAINHGCGLLYAFLLRAFRKRPV
jgi:hypothetical protein